MLKEAYVRGAFLGSGSISDPKKIYHMEFVCTSEKNAIFLQKIINDWELKAKRVWRKQNIVVYLKESNHIIELLTRIGAHSSILEMENIRILKEINNNINRAYNCDSANIDRTVKSATEQIESIYKIRKHLGIDSLSPQLKEVAELRIAYPEASLNELAMLSEGLTRSGINHRLRKIKQIADEIMVIQEEK